jgi:alpha-beta hydrolase superfamily lysophospholipase
VTRRNLAVALVVAAAPVALINSLAYAHARAMTHFTLDGAMTSRPESLSFAQKVEAVAFGIQVPKRKNTRTPQDLGLAYETWKIPVEEGVELEAWDVPREVRRGVVVLFHGYADRKSSVLAEARAFHALGFEPMLVDFRASGGSSGYVTSIGFHEARDVAAALRAIREKRPDEPLVLWGVSMGGAASLRAVGGLGETVDALIVEAPFATMRSAIVNRFTTLGVPTPVLVDLFMFWGGRQLGFDPATHNPVDYAASVRAPTLVLLGSEDKRVLRPEGWSVFSALGGEKRFQLFDGLGHESLVRGNRELWIETVSDFLSRFGVRTAGISKAS